MKCLIAKYEEKVGNKLILDGLVRVNEKKPEFGGMMLEAPDQVVLSPSGFLNRRRKVGFINGRITDLTAIIEKFELVAGTDYSEKFGPHKIVTIEKLEDEVTDKDFFREKINPTTKALLMKGDKKVMFKTLVVPDNPEIVDVYVEHDSVPTTATSTAAPQAQNELETVTGKPKEEDLPDNMKK